MAALADHINHLRLIHFAWVVLSGATATLALATWSDTPELERELLDLQTEIKTFRESPTATIMQFAPDENRKIVGEIANHIAAGLHNTMWAKPDRKIVSSIIADWHGLWSVTKSPNLPADPLNNSILELMNALDSSQWTIVEVASLHANWDELARMVAGYDKLIVTDISEVRNGWIEVTLRYTYFIKFGSEGWQERAIDRKWTFAVGRRPVTISLPKSWTQSRFPTIVRHMDELQFKSLGEASRWAGQNRTVLARTRKVKILDMEFDGDTLISVSPLVILTLLLYMAVYLHHLRGLSNQSHLSGLADPLERARWIALLQTPLARLIVFMTFTVLPALAAYLSLSRNWNLRPLIRVGGATTIFMLGYWLYRLCADVAMAASTARTTQR